jgi:dienelactone hydrolase
MTRAVAIAACCLIPLAAAQKAIPESADPARRAADFIRTYPDPSKAPFETLSRLYDYDRKAPLDLKESGVETRGGIQIHEISYASPLGGRVPASVFVPPGKGPFAGMILMHGGGGNRGQMVSAALMFAKTGAVCLTLDAPFSGGRAIPGQEIQDWEHAERSTGGLIQNIVDLRRGVDLLLARPDIDPNRLGFYAASFGAITGGVLAGLEHRIQAYVLMSCPASFNDAQVERRLKVSRTMPKEEFARSTAIMEIGAPVYYVGHAAPSALLIQIGEKDVSIPRASAERLYKAASDPKLLRWYDGGHGLNNQARLDSSAWLQKQIGIGPLDAADQQRLSAAPRK